MRQSNPKSEEKNSLFRSAQALVPVALAAAICLVATTPPDATAEEKKSRFFSDLKKKFTRKSKGLTGGWRGDDSGLRRDAHTRNPAWLPPPKPAAASKKKEQKPIRAQDYLYGQSSVATRRAEEALQTKQNSKRGISARAPSNLSKTDTSPDGSQISSPPLAPEGDILTALRRIKEKEALQEALRLRQESLNIDLATTKNAGSGRESPILKRYRLKTEVEERIVLRTSDIKTKEKRKPVPGEDGEDIPTAFPSPGEEGIVISPYARGKHVNVRGLRPNTVVQDPYSGKMFRVP